MIATRNSIAGEVFRLQRNFSVPMTERYMKLFNSKQFVVKVARQLEQLYPEYDVTLSETEENYILRVKEYDKDEIARLEAELIKANETMAAVNAQSNADVEEARSYK